MSIDIKCTTAEEYIQTLSLSNSMWWEDSQCHWIFRGQPPHTQLLPSLLRQSGERLEYQRIFNLIHSELPGNPSMQGALDRITGHLIYNISQQKRKNLAELIKAYFVEIDLTEKFLARSNEIRLETPTLKLFKDQPEDKSSALHFYDRIATINLIRIFIEPAIGGFKNQSIFGFDRLHPFDYPEAMALARHHGVPSRLLDWTREPLYAAFFSASSPNNEGICVWALNKKHLSQDCGHGQIAFHEKLNKKGLEFLHIQKGVFTDLVGLDRFFYDHGYWPSLDEYLGQTYFNHQKQPYEQSTYLRKIELVSGEKDALLRRLNRMDINTHTLMPTYDNVGKSVIPKPVSKHHIAMHGQPLP